MDVTALVKELVKKTGISEESAKKVNKLFGSNLLASKLNKEKIVAKIVKELKVSETVANKVYDVAMDFISKNVKSKLTGLLKK